ncbi:MULTISPECIES: aminopeptidase [Salinibaculum]|uniref:aminopeptidase n=1 Tax=Salinibaculum TaxID=2732368 RepID=UPI0030D35242
MSEVTKAVRVANRAVRTLLDVQQTDTVLVVTDESGMRENGAIVDAVVGTARDIGAETNLITIEDVPTGVEYVPEMVESAMGMADVLIGITKTTAASVIHNEVPEQLEAAGQLRRLYMVKRSFDALTSPNVLEADYEEMLALGTRIREFVEDKSRIEITSTAGTDVTASIEDAHWKQSSFAHEPGQMTGISWGEVNSAPVVGTMEGTAVIDGPILEYGWPSPPLELTIREGKVVDVSGDDSIAPRIQRLIEDNENAENIGEIAFSLNDHADLRETNIWKKGRGRLHIAIGNGTSYGQNVVSPVHEDLVMNVPTVVVDGETLIDEGEFVLGEND